MNDKLLGNIEDPLVIYHANCADGSCAAWLAQEQWPGATLHAATYGSVPPSVAGKDVILVDFTYPREMLLMLKEQARSLVVFDHHEPTRKDLEGLDFCVFDNARCGVSLFLEHLDPRVRALAIATEIVPYVEDGDLWRFRLRDSRAVRAALEALGVTERWGAWYSVEACTLHELVLQGNAIRLYQERFVDQAIKGSTVVRIGEHNVPMIVWPSGLSVSEAVEQLIRVKGVKIGMALYPDGTGGLAKVSIRSAEGGPDVAKIAKQFGGGGHVHAAGFRLPYDGMSEAIRFLSEVSHALHT